MDEPIPIPIDFAAVDALLARSEQTARELAELIRQTREMQGEFRAPREGWRWELQPAPLRPRHRY
jgi:hypothetical protein